MLRLPYHILYYAFYGIIYYCITLDVQPGHYISLSAFSSCLPITYSSQPVSGVTSFHTNWITTRAFMSCREGFIPILKSPRYILEGSHPSKLVQLITPFLLSKRLNWWFGSVGHYQNGVEMEEKWGQIPSHVLDYFLDNRVLFCFNKLQKMGMILISFQISSKWII